jgi:hypothetical protein
VKDSERAAFLVAFQEVLKPLMRIGRHYGLSGLDILDAFAQASVEFEAERITTGEARPPSAARVAMYTGLNQTEVVSRLAQQGLAARNYARRAQALSALLNAWHTQSGYAAVYDLAREIPFDAPPHHASFCALCRVHAPEFDPDELLADLFASSCIERLDGGYLRAVTRAYVLPPGDVARLDRMGKVLINLTEAFAKSLMGNGGRFSAFAERTLVSDFPLSDSGVASFDTEVRVRGTKLLTDLDSWLSSQGPRLSAEEGPRYGLGLYVFEDVAAAGRTPIEVLDEEQGSDVPVAPVSERFDSEFVLDVLNHPLSKPRG